MPPGLEQGLVKVLNDLSIVSSKNVEAFWYNCHLRTTQNRHRSSSVAFNTAIYISCLHRAENLVHVYLFE